MNLYIEALQSATTSLQNFNQLTESNTLPNIRKASLPDACRSYKVLRDLYETLDEHRKKLGDMLEDLNRETIPTIMEEAGSPSIKVDVAGTYYRFVRSQRMSASVVDKQGGYDWLRSNGHGGMIQETVNAQTLGAFTKRWVQDDGKDLPAEYFKLSLMNVVSVTKA